MRNAFVAKYLSITLKKIRESCPLTKDLIYTEKIACGKYVAFCAFCNLLFPT